MKRTISALACFLHTLSSGCLEYIKIEDEAKVSETFGFPPVIDISGLNPSPALLTNAISLGKDCKGQTFIVPYIADRNVKDQLYYLWFFDQKLALPQSVIEPESRHLHIPTISVDKQFLVSFFENKIPPEFFNRSHVLEFFVSDQPYDVPERRYQRPTSEKSHGDYAYWIVTFTEDAC
jgi:hypothetical protein